MLALSRLVVIFTALLASASAQELWLPQVFGDHMVLQRGEAPVFGRAAPGAQVSVRGSWSDRAVTTEAGADGAFSVTLATPDAPGPFTLEVTAADQRRAFEDVLVGEVWVCSGQSNMEWSVARAQDADLVAAMAARPRLRLFTVPNVVAAAPADDCDGSWRVSTPDAVRTFSAVGFAFGSRLLSALDVPVGLIAADWGGTPAEAWTTQAGLRTVGDFDEALAVLAELEQDRAALDAAHDAAVATWQEAFARAEPGSAHAWYARNIDDSGWQSTAVPGAWAGTPLAGFDGTVWYRRRVELPAAWRGRELVLSLGPIDDHDATWFDGELVGETRTWSTPRRYRVPGRLVTGGAHTIAVRVHDTGGEGGFRGEAAALSVHPVEDPDAKIELAGTWLMHRGAAHRELPAMPARPSVNAHTPSALWNGMLAPVAPYGIRGAVWYQGESNVGRGEQYQRLFPAMIESWREAWGRGVLPFYFVQIAPYGYRNDTGAAGALREAQLLTMQNLPATGMVVTTDIGNPRDIHPRDKETVGARLARWALARTYGVEVACAGPLYAGMEVRDGAAVLRFTLDPRGGGLQSRGGPLTCFRIAGDDRVFHDAQARIDGDTVVVRSDAVAQPVAVRFAWGAADEPNLQCAAGLPASPFRTDTW